jgi:hypothetical protein
VPPLFAHCSAEHVASDQPPAKAEQEAPRP